MLKHVFVNYEEIQAEIDRSLGEDQPPQCGDIETSFGVKTLVELVSPTEKWFFSDAENDGGGIEDVEMDHPLAGFIVHTDTMGNVSNEEFTCPDDLARAWDSYEHEAALIFDLGEDGEE